MFITLLLAALELRVRTLPNPSSLACGTTSLAAQDACGPALLSLVYTLESFPPLSCLASRFGALAVPLTRKHIDQSTTHPAWSNTTTSPRRASAVLQSGHSSTGESSRALSPATQKFSSQQLVACSCDLQRKAHSRTRLHDYSTCPTHSAANQRGPAPPALALPLPRSSNCCPPRQTGGRKKQQAPHLHGPSPSSAVVILTPEPAAHLSPRLDSSAHVTLQVSTQRAEPNRVLSGGRGVVGEWRAKGGRGQGGPVRSEVASY